MNHQRPDTPPRSPETARQQRCSRHSILGAVSQPVAWRAGIDLNLLDATNPDTCRWLLTLVWPEQQDRRARLKEAFTIVRSDPPDLRRSDLLQELPGLVVEALAAMPEHGRLIVFHSAVIAYLDVPNRERFAALMGDLVADPRVHWISNEGPKVLPDITLSGHQPPPGRFVLGGDTPSATRKGTAAASTGGANRLTSSGPDGRPPRPGGQCRSTMKSVIGVVGSRW